MSARVHGVVAPMCCNAVGALIVVTLFSDRPPIYAWLFIVTAALAAAVSVWCYFDARRARNEQRKML